MVTDNDVDGVRRMNGADDDSDDVHVKDVPDSMVFVDLNTCVEMNEGWVALVRISLASHCHCSHQ